MDSVYKQGRYSEYMYLAFKNLKLSSKNVNSNQKAKSKVRIIFLRWKCNHIEAADAITFHTAKTSRDNVFERKQTTKKVLRSMFRGLEVRTKVRSMFWRSNKCMKGKSWCFYMLKSLRKDNNWFFGLLQETRKVQCIYLSFKNFKISSKKGQQ